MIYFSKYFSGHSGANAAERRGNADKLPSYFLPVVITVAVLTVVLIHIAGLCACCRRRYVYSYAKL